MKKVLSGLSINEQIDYFELEQSNSREDFSYGESSGAFSRTDTHTLRYEMTSNGYVPTVLGLIVSEGIIVGWIYSGKRVCLLNEVRCTYWAIEDDGTGRSEVETYSKLVFTGKKSV